jgi:carbamate kinase
MTSKNKSVLIAIGGNSLIRSGQRGTIEEQLANARETAEGIVRCVQEGWSVVVTHGNGPQVGAALLRSERSANEVYRQPLDVCVALTQGEIGYALQLGLERSLRRSKISLPVVTVITQVEVRKDDPAFQNPTKPVGPFYSGTLAAAMHREYGWKLVEDSSRGYRRVVPSPEPLRILELDAIRALRVSGALVIATGGGGIPVIIEADGSTRGVEAVIDKDRASAALGAALGIDIMLISTDVDRIYLHYRKTSQQPLDRVTVPRLRQYHAQGHFPPGSMGPKVESAIQFLENGGKEVIITSSYQLLEALQGNAGTHIVMEET